MISNNELYDIMYDEAFRLKKAKAWRMLDDREIVAVRTMHDGTWFCTLMVDEYGYRNGICVYDEQSGVSVLRQIMDLELDEGREIYEQLELVLSHYGYIIGFASKSSITEDPVGAGTLDYCKRKKIRARGKNFYPMIKVLRPHHIPWKLETEADLRIVTAVMRVFGQMDDDFVWQNGGGTLERFDEKIAVPVFVENEDGSFRLGTMQLPRCRELEYSSPDWNDLQAARLKKVKKTSSVWLAECFLMMQCIAEGGDELAEGEHPEHAPFYPENLVVLDDATGSIVMMESSSEDADYEVILDKLCSVILSNGRPRQILVRTKRTEKFFKKLCRRLDIKLVLDEELLELKDLRDDFMSDLSGIDYMDAYDEDGCGTYDENLQPVDILDEDFEKKVNENFTRMVKSGALSELPNSDFAAAVDFFLINDGLGMDVLEVMRKEYRRRRRERIIGMLKFGASSRGRRR